MAGLGDGAGVPTAVRTRSFNAVAGNHSTVFPGLTPPIPLIFRGNNTPAPTFTNLSSSTLPAVCDPRDVNTDAKVVSETRKSLQTRINCSWVVVEMGLRPVQAIRHKSA